MQKGTQMAAEQLKRREDEYRELMGKAEQVTSGQTTVVVMPGAPADYFFPWELSQHLATGSTTAEKSSK